MTPRSHIITGGNRGFGLACAQEMMRRLEGTGDHLIVTVRSEEACRQAQARLGDRVVVERLDLTSPVSIAALASRLSSRPIASVLHNAGVQHTRIRRTGEGFEEAFAVHCLGPLRLTDALLPCLQQARVIAVGSGTIDASNVAARMGGFRGARFKSVRDSAFANEAPPQDLEQDGRDRYATTKLLAIGLSRELARRLTPEEGVAYAFDPGMMPGTGLAREQSGMRRLAWSHVLPAMGWMLPDTSTPRRSAKHLAALLLAEVNPPPGALVHHERRDLEAAVELGLGSNTWPQIWNEVAALANLNGLSRRSDRDARRDLCEGDA